MMKAKVVVSNVNNRELTKNKVETAAEILNNSFKAAVDSLVKRNGALGEKWQWWQIKATGVRHLIPGMDALSRLNIKTGGGPRIVNATGGGHGPSWRMIVQLGKEGPKAFGLYPGGQSGNPGSKFYDNMIDKWANGELNELLYLRSKDDKSSRIVKRVGISGSK